MPDAVLSVERVRHVYGERAALDGVTFQVEPGERFGLLGPNGSGKTTLFRLITTLMRPTEGAVRVFGEDAARAPEAVRRRLGVVFQHAALDLELTVLENLRTHAALLGVADRDERIAELLAAFGLTERAGDRVKTLSGGLVRRADLARGLLHRPALLLLDEPTTGLDPTARRDLWTTLDRLQLAEGTTVVVATHLMDEAERCARIGILSEGRLVALGTPAALRAELGGEALWLESDTPDRLADELRDRLALAPKRVGSALLVETAEAPALLARVLDAVPEHVTAATVRRPTLDDVFAVRTGARPAPQPASA